MKYPQSLQDLIDSFMLFPGVGVKTAERFAFHVLLKLNNEQVNSFSENIKKAYNSIKKCQLCGNLTDSDICEVCSDQDREPILMVVESSKEVSAFEKTNQFKGKYHVLNGLISPLNGIGPESINLNNLAERVQKESIKKVIISTSANIPGEMTAIYIKNILSSLDIEIYRIGYGLPVGGDIEYADEVTLSRALEGIKKF